MTKKEKQKILDADAAARAAIAAYDAVIDTADAAARAADVAYRKLQDLLDLLDSID